MVPSTVQYHYEYQLSIDRADGWSSEPVREQLQLEPGDADWNRSKTTSFCGPFERKWTDV